MTIVAIILGAVVVFVVASFALLMATADKTEHSIPPKDTDLP